MDEILKFAQILKASPALLPWVVFVAVGLVFWRERDLFKGYIRARIDAHRESARFSMSYAELVRNNTAALENNTAALKLVEHDRDRLADLVEHHEKVSKERIDHLQTVINRIDATVTKNSREIALIEDRTDK